MSRGHYDIIIIGARCAGAATALLLARRGYCVLLVDRARFPSDIPHGNYIHRDGPRRLRRWGLLDRLVATGCPPISGLTIDLGDFPLQGADLVVDGVALGYAPRRSVLDQLLVDAAVEAGAEFRDASDVKEFTADGDRLTGIRTRSTSNGTVLVDRATMVVGADGRRSRVAAAVCADTYDACPATACWYFSYFSGVHLDGCEVRWRSTHGIFAVPTHGGLAGVFVGWPMGDLPRVRAGTEAAFMSALDAVPAIGERVRAARRVDRFYGATDMSNFFRKPWGAGWALVGDAGYHKDPALALGISDAFRDAELLAGAIDDGLSGSAPMVEALAAYESQRNAEVRDDYRQNLHLARFRPAPPDVFRARAAVHGNPAAINRYFMIREGMIPPGDP
jgi:2-polyprenyl-6-methoxyphenol hydroxylase-like FAD-dependent oxidoreductase